ncbi:hypothetical protein [Photobacterium leiognathi]|uniref:hypothetical protein n=3 Tax=Photobacterium leiognathi TaxID=553611 RepID=UPI0027386BA0|nr:hypothetical protein [Photobacterium leiognathi]
MNFYALRVSLVAKEPQLFSGKKMSDDIYSFEDALRYSEKQPPTTEHKEIRFSIKINVDGKNDGVMAGIVARAQSLHGYDSNFIEYNVDNFPPLIWLWDREQQVILVEKKTSVFQNASSACKAFEVLANNIELAEINIRAEIEPILNSVSKSFWEEYDSFESVESVRFELTPPNLFGSTEKEMQKALNDTTENTNANKVITTFENRDAKLNLKSEGFIGNLVNWCRKGGGHWIMKGLKSGRSKSSRISSEKVAKIITMEGKGITEIELRQYSVSDLKEIMGIYRPQYDYDDNRNSIKVRLND